MSLTKYETFMEVAKTQNMSKAAENTNQTVPGVSYAVSKLEEEFGVPLFIRNRGRIILSEAGEKLHPYITEVLNAQRKLEQAVASIKGTEQGTVRIGGMSSATKRWLPGIIKDMNKQYPDIHIEIILNLYEKIEEDLMEGVIDVAFAGEPLSKALDFHQITKDPFVVVMAKSNPLSKNECISLEMIREEKLILPNWQHDKEFMKLIEKSNLKKQAIYMIKDVETIVSMVENHMGITILPKYVSNEKAEICAVELSDWPAKRLGIVTLALENLLPTTKKFVQCAERWLKENAGK